MKTQIKILGVSLLLGLTACQQEFYQPNSLALQTTEKYAKLVSASFLPKAAKANSARGIAYNNGYNTSYNTGYNPLQYWNYGQWGYQWNQTSQTGVYGSTMMYPQMSQETLRCEQMVSQIDDTKIENLEFMLGTLERCLFRLAIHKSAPMNYMWRNESPEILNYGGYLNDYVRPAQYGQYNYDMYSQFLLSGQTQLGSNQYGY